MRAILLAAALSALACTLHGQTSRDYAVEITANVQTAPAQVTLDWTVAGSGTSYSIYKRNWGATTWGGAIATTTALTWSDSAVSVGSTYEYGVARTGGAYTSWGFITVGIERPAVHDRGRIVLVIDDAHTTALGAEFARLERDLEGDGWTVVRHDIANSSTVAQIKALIVAAYNAAPATTKAVLLIGDLTVPYSGNFNPDAHPDHQGAWAADIYYGDVNGTWTDTSVNNTVASRAENDNIPGDGKFDQSTFNTGVELMVGRVDLSNMTTFTNTEQQRLKAYLDRNHDFRTKVWAPQMRALVDDNFSAATYTEAFASSAWRGFAPMFGPANVSAVDFISSTSANSYMWAYGCGGGSYTSAGGIGNTGNIAANTLQVPFTSLFGSYFGDWDINNNFLRAPLCAGALTCCWSGRPHWYFHGMAQGESIGHCLYYTQNHPSLNTSSNFGVHVALMGDPTLRLHMIAPATSFSGVQNGAAVDLAWTASTDTVLGYHVYRRDAGVWTRLTTNHVTGTSFTDSAAPLGSVEYMVRAYRLEQGSGSYFNLSQGEFTSVNVTGVLPTINNQPDNIHVAEGNTATFTVTATGATGYQWQRNNVDIPGANADSYTTPATTLAEDGDQFRCVVSNAAGDVPSNAATLTVSINGPGNGGGGGGGGDGGGGGCAAAAEAWPWALLAFALLRRRKRDGCGA